MSLLLFFFPMFVFGHLSEAQLDSYFNAKFASLPRKGGSRTSRPSASVRFSSWYYLAEFACGLFSCRLCRSESDLCCSSSEMATYQEPPQRALLQSSNPVAIFSLEADTSSITFGQNEDVILYRISPGIRKLN